MCCHHIEFDKFSDDNSTKWQMVSQLVGDGGGRILGAMPFAANLAGVRAQLRANRTKNEKNQAEFASRPRDTKRV